MKAISWKLLPLILTAACASAEPQSAQDKSKAWGPIVAGAHWHHVHLNVTDPDKSLAFYTRHFDAWPETFAGSEQAIWTQRSWLMFNKVNSPPSSSIGTAINHIGWGAPDARAEFERQKALGATFDTELRDISIGLGAKETGQFYFMYVKGPNGELIELNTDPDNNFGHIHLNSMDPIAAGAWYANVFGATPAPPYFPHLAVQTGSGTISRQFIDNVNMIIIRARDSEEIRPTTGSVIDHIAFSVPNLETALAAARAREIKVLAEPAVGGPGWRHAFIEGPDRIAIELVEDETVSPAITD